MNRRHAILLLAAAPGCIFNPTNRTTQESTAAITISGYTDDPGKLVIIQAKNALTGTWVNFPSATSSTSPDPFEPSLYPWSKTLTFPSWYWSPQVTYTFNGKNYTAHRTGPGRLEVVAKVDGGALYTFSETAKDCWSAAFLNGASPRDAGIQCADGTSLVQFDNSGVDSPAEPGGWTVKTGPFNETSSGVPITWHTGHYEVQGHDVYGLVCRPQGAGPFPVQIINHGGYDGLDSVAALETCKRAAARGWLTAMSAYRGEQMAGFAGLTVNADPAQWELCLGEVTDVLRLTDLVLDFAEADPTRVLMWGHSHGACVTERAVQQGAPVTVAASFAAPTDFPAWHAYCSAPGVPCNVVTHTAQGLELTLGGPPASAPAAYAWRSPLNFAVDLKERRDMKFLALQGTADPMVYPTQACALAQSIQSTNWHVINAMGGTSTTAPAGPFSGGSCTTASTTVTWQSTAVPGSAPGAWTQPRNLVVYDGYDHGTIVQSGVLPGYPALRPWQDFERFVQSQGLPLP